MTTIPLSKEELLSAHNNGTLEGLLLGYGILPLKALESVLESSNEEREGVNLLHQEIETLLDTIEDLEYKLSQEED